MKIKFENSELRSCLGPLINQKAVYAFEYVPLCDFWSKLNSSRYCKFKDGLWMLCVPIVPPPPTHTLKFLNCVYYSPFLCINIKKKKKNTVILQLLINMKFKQHW